MMKNKLLIKCNNYQIDYIKYIDERGSNKETTNIYLKNTNNIKKICSQAVNYNILNFDKYAEILNIIHSIDKNLLKSNHDNKLESKLEKKKELLNKSAEELKK